MSTLTTFLARLSADLVEIPCSFADDETAAVRVQLDDLTRDSFGLERSSSGCCDLGSLSGATHRQQARSCPRPARGTSAACL